MGRIFPQQFFFPVRQKDVRLECMRIAFQGFRHGHIRSLYKLVQRHPDCEFAGAAEDDPTARAELSEIVEFTHDSCAALLKEADCDAIAIGDYYGRRGELAIAALTAGKHVICDKPICTSLTELAEIERLAKEKNLAVGCQLTFRNLGIMRTIRETIAAGTIGTVQAISFTGQHPLNYGNRPGWYFEEGKHGGTLNDIAIHGIDCIPWITGLQFDTVAAARTWSSNRVPGFNDCAQMMNTLSNGAGVIGDVSYLAPDSIGSKHDHYWAFLVWGSEGLLDMRVSRSTLTLSRNGDKEAVALPLQDGDAAAYMDGFLLSAKGETNPLLPSTADVISAARTALETQAAADQHSPAKKL